MSIREYQNQIEEEEEYKKIKIAQEKIKLEILKINLAVAQRGELATALHKKMLQKY